MTYYQLKFGFTLVELLVVIAILSVLSTLGVSNFRSSRLKARDVERKTSLQAVAKSLESYANDHRSYPLSNMDNEIICQSSTNTACPWGSALTDGTTTYMATLPSEANTSLSYAYISDGSSYTLYAYLENDNDPQRTTGLTTMCGTQTCNYQFKSSNQP